jgi:DNA polymerase I-like protein with 3'-5' exonuclease and polymerase domains
LFELKKENKIASLILEYRENSKILSTYVDPILSISEKNNGIIKTTLLQTNTSTGRLSSEKPNLQNIPQDSKWSRKFRKSFVPRDGFKLVSFDYSQLELRLLAHISQDKKLIQAFKEGKDIHTLTAQQVFNLKDVQQITPQMRRLAKTLNFGVVYGMGARAFSEASETNIEDSKRFIEEYFHDFPDVKKWQEKTKQEMRENGYVKNINGRIRFFDINKNINQRINSEYERAAINMPVQSLGADILKTAMNNVYKLITSDKKYKNNINLLLSIHDELMFEVRNDILIETAAEIKKIMENSYNLSVPLKVDIKSGPNWGEMSPI